MIYVFFAEGFEEIEALTTVDILRRCNLSVETVSISDSQTVKGAHNIPLLCDKVFEQIDKDPIEAIVLPGGMPGAANLAQHQGLKTLLIDHNDKQGLIAAICAAPMVLGKHGILSGRKATCYPGFEEELTGAQTLSEYVVRDGNIITGRGPAAAADFGYAIASVLTDQTTVDNVRKGMLFA